MSLESALLESYGAPIIHSLIHSANRNEVKIIISQSCRNGSGGGGGRHQKAAAAATTATTALRTAVAAEVDVGSPQTMTMTAIQVGGGEIANSQGIFNFDYFAIAVVRRRRRDIRVDP